MGGTAEEKATQDETVVKVVAAAVAAATAALAGSAPAAAAEPAAPAAPEPKPAAEEESAETPGYISELIAYKSLKKVANKIADEVNEAKPERILITNDLNLVASSAGYLQVLTQLRFISSQLKGVLDLASSRADLELFSVPPFGGDKEGPKETSPEPKTSSLDTILAGLTSWGAIAKAGVDLIGYFQPEFEFSGSKVTIPNQALNALIAGKLEGSRMLKDFHELKSSALVTKFNAAVARRNQVVVCQAQFAALLDILAASIEELKARIEQETKQADKDELVKQLKEQAERETTTKTELAGMGALVKLFDEFAANVLTVKEGENYSPLMAAVIQEYVSQDANITHYLYVSILSSGAETITRKGFSLFVWLPIKTFSGGSVANYVLLEKETGNVVKANTIHRFYAVDLRYGVEATRFVENENFRLFN
jgi:hypothetical protein